MATSTFDFDNAGAVAGGDWEYAFTTSLRCMFPVGSLSTWDLTIAGTDATIAYAQTSIAATTLEVSVDGGAYADIPSPASINVYTAKNLFAGLSDAAHAVTVRLKGAAATTAYVQVVNGISVTGAAPAVALSGGYGPYYRGVHAGFTRKFVPEGVVTQDSSFNYNRLILNSPDGSLRFTGNPTSIKVWTALNSNKLKVWQDGALVGTTTTLGASGYGWTTLASGLDGATHTYQIINCNSNQFVPVYLVGVMLVGGDLVGSPPAPRPSIVWGGDSITAGVGTADSTTAFPWQVCQLKGYASINQGYSGQTTVATGALSASADRYEPAWFPPAVYAETVKYVVLNSGHNDGSLPNLGTTSSEYRAALVRMMTTFKSAYPNATLIALSPFDTTAYSTTIRDNLATDMSAAATAVGGWTYVRTCSTATGANFSDGWLTSSGDLPDGTHPNATGYGKIVTNLSPYIATSSAMFGGGSGILTNSLNGGLL